MPHDDETEFGLGPGLIEDQKRADRNLTVAEQLMEIRSLPKSFDHSLLNRPEPEDTPVPRLIPGDDRG